MIFKYLNPASLYIAALMSAALVTGCGDSSTTEASEQQSKLTISLTDAEGDFTHYTVDVTALKLYRANGAVIETLPNTTTLDFAQYIDVSEFLTTRTVPAGFYTGAEITLDYTNADLAVENEDGSSIPANAVDNDGAPLQFITLNTLINSTEGFVIKAGQPASLSIDFDLEASNQVVIDPSGESATVTVNPVLVANTSIDDEKTRRVRGLLADVDIENESFTVDIRPFRIRHLSYGEITVFTDDETVYEIDGLSYDAESGLAALDQLDTLSPVVALGLFDFNRKRYLATQVYAGSSVPWDDKDELKGSVIARSGNTLTVLGATIELDDGHFQFNDEVTVVIDETTHVNKQGSKAAVSIDDISIGQKVMILGDMTDDNTMDATDEGIVRMRYSDVSGSVTSVSPLQVSLQHINRRNVTLYDFSGSGVDQDNDADPLQYEVNTGNLNLKKLDINSAVRVKGYPTAFGTAPEDFDAKTVIDFSNGITAMTMSYGEDGSSSAVVALDETGLLLDVDSATGRHHIKQAGLITDIANLPTVPVIQPADGRALYAISQGRSLDVFTQWERFQLALTELLSMDRHVTFVHSKGIFEANALTMTSRYLVVRLTESE